MTDLLAATAELVDVSSVSHHETAIAGVIEARLRAVPWLSVDRVGDNIVARTQLGRDQRLVLAGHTDTVPANGNERSRIEGDVLWGLGSADMKAGLAVMLELAATIDATAVDVTYVFYVCEEVDQKFNGLLQLLAQRPDLLAADAAILGEPTGAVIEAGCQGTLRVATSLRGERAHTARPWLGRNAIHRLGPLLDLVGRYEARRPVLDGCEYREALQAVRVEGGVANNVVPDLAVVTLNHRFAPDRSVPEAMAALQSFFEAGLGEGDTLELVDSSDPAPPSLNHPLLAGLSRRTGSPPRAKLGWTDVSFFAAHGIPATNFGPGEPEVAHTAGERVDRGQLDAVFGVLASLLAEGG